jgi:hypothetical protein
MYQEGGIRLGNFVCRDVLVLEQVADRRKKRKQRAQVRTAESGLNVHEDPYSREQATILARAASG